MNRLIVCSALLVCASQFANAAVKDFDSLETNSSATAVYHFGGPFVDEIGDLVEAAQPSGKSHAGDALIYDFQEGGNLRDTISFNLYTDTIIPVQIESVTKTFSLVHGFNVLNWSLDDGLNGSTLGGVTLGSSFYWTVGFADNDPHLDSYAIGATTSAPGTGNWNDPTMMYVDFGTGLEEVSANPSPLTGYQGPMGRVEILATPEPSSFALMGLGLVGLVIRRRRK